MAVVAVDAADWGFVLQNDVRLDRAWELSPGITSHLARCGRQGQQEDDTMPNQNPASEYLDEAREALLRATTPEQEDLAFFAHTEALMLHALAEQLGR